MFQVLAYLLGAAALFMAGFGSGSYMTSAKITGVALEQQKSDFEERIAADQRVYASSLKDVQAARSIDKETADRLEFVESTSRSILERISRAPRSVMCINSPVLRAYVDSLRQQQPSTRPLDLSVTSSNRLPERTNVPVDPGR